MIGFALFAALLSPAAASLVLRHNSTGWEKPAIKHRLRVCNAYPSSHALRVLKNNEEFMGESQMKYKECTELKGTLNEGDRLNFQADDSIPLSTFTVNDLPKEQSTLLLVAYRESKDSAKIAFKSHIFTVSKVAQLAVIDTFQGETKAKLSISEFRCNRHSTGSAPALQIPMKFSTVMALESGIYEVKITSGAKTHSVGPFNVADGEDYVVLRTGLDDVESVSRHAKPSHESFLLNVASIDQPPSFLQEKSGRDTGGDFGDSLSLLATHKAMDGQGATLEGTSAESDSVQLSAMHAGKNEKEDAVSVDLSAQHKAEEGAGTGGPGFVWDIDPDVPKSHGHTRTDHGESLDQFLGLAQVGSYPQEFVIHPLLKPVQNPCPAAKDEHSGATAVGSLTALAVAILATALL